MQSQHAESAPANIRPQMHSSCHVAWQQAASSKLRADRCQQQPSGRQAAAAQRIIPAKRSAPVTHPDACADLLRDLSCELKGILDSILINLLQGSTQQGSTYLSQLCWQSIARQHRSSTQRTRSTANTSLALSSLWQQQQNPSAPSGWPSSRLAGRQPSKPCSQAGTQPQETKR